MKYPVHLAAGVLLFAMVAAGQQRSGKPQPSARPSPLQPVEFLVGHWQGATQGKPGHGKGERRYQLVLGGKFLRGTNKTVYPPQQKNPKGETHEDIAFFSYDRGKNRIVLRQFHVEGFVNEYAARQVAADGKTVVFETERIENIPDGWRARETYKIVSPDEFVEVFELAEPQKEFTVYAESRWKRVK
jgi:hypothetical protein